MSFGNRSSYATLKDAYGITEFIPAVEETYTLKKEEISTVPTVLMESFTPETLTVQETYCVDCNCKGKRGGRRSEWLNEILNLILIGILLWILLFKPLKI